jgi:hypothetical protein
VKRKTSESFFEKLKKYLPFKKNLNLIINNTSLDDYTGALEKSIEEILSDDSITDRKSAIMGNINCFIEMIRSMEISKADRTISGKNLEKLKTALSEIQSLVNLSDADGTEKGTSETKGSNIQKISNAGNNGRNGENEMALIELKQTVDDALTPLNEKLEELEKVNKELISRLEAVEKSTPGSRQAIKKEHGCKNQIPIWTE